MGLCLGLNAKQLCLTGKRRVVEKLACYLKKLLYTAIKWQQAALTCTATKLCIAARNTDLLLNLPLKGSAPVPLGS